MSIPIAIVDDKQVNRISLKEKLAPFAEIELTLEAVNGTDFLEQLNHVQPGKTPKVVLMDLEMPELDGIQTIAIASPANPEIKFIVVTVFEDSEKIFEAIKAGAHGYLLKDERGSNIVDAITQVQQDGMPMSPIVARKAIEMLKKISTIPTETKPLLQPSTILSEREMDILVELATGKSYKAIGEKLFISPFTVRKHVSNIYNKLHVDSRTKVINVAQKNRWV